MKETNEMNKKIEELKAAALDAIEVRNNAYDTYTAATYDRVVAYATACNADSNDPADTWGDFTSDSANAYTACDAYNTACDAYDTACEAYETACDAYYQCA